MSKNAPTTDPPTECRYRWRTGDCLTNYGTSAKLWTEFSSSEDFAAGFKAIIEDATLTNDTRAARVEAYLLAQATVAEVLDISSTRCTSLNPNKWDKHLAPWFNPKCAEARRQFKGASCRYGKRHVKTLHALQEFLKCCKDSRAQMQFQLPEMLKQQPKKFWGLLRSKATQDIDMTIEEFIKFNESIFYDSTIAEDTFSPLADPRPHHITPAELTHILTHHFKADKSSGLSPMPL